MSDDSLLLPVDSYDLILRALLYVVELAEAGDMDAIVSAGLSQEDINRLRQIPTADLLRIAASHGGLIEIKINRPRLNLAISTIEAKRLESEQFAYLARAGATATILADLFRVTQEEAQAHISVLEITRPTGRPALPDTATRDLIHAWWGEHQAIAVRERWIALHQAWSQYRIATLYAVVNEFNL